MKKIIDEVQGEGLEKLLGETVTLFCCRHIYTGKLIGVNDDCVLLKDPAIVYETGPFSDKEWKDKQDIINTSKEWYVKVQSIESFGIMK